VNGPPARSGAVTAILLCCLLLAGCATRQPQTVELPAADREPILTRFGEFSRSQCVQSMDADVTLEIALMGKTEKAAGMLLVQSPTFLRYTAVDPLDRALMILVTDGSTFTMVDNRNAEAYTGSVDSAFWHEYMPAAIAVEDLLPWLTGRLSDNELQVSDVRGNKADPKTVWVFASSTDGWTHELLFDRKTMLLRRHIIKLENGEVLLDLVYRDYAPHGAACALPGKVVVEGQAVTGTLTITFDRIFPDGELAPSLFELDLPAHYSLQEVE